MGERREWRWVSLYGSSHFVSRSPSEGGLPHVLGQAAQMGIEHLPSLLTEEPEDQILRQPQVPESEEGILERREPETRSSNFIYHWAQISS